MKKTIIMLGILVLTLSMTLSSCKKDKTETKNSIKYNQTEFEIGTVLGLEYGESPISGVFGIQMQFLEKSLLLHYVNSTPDSLSGSGDILLVTFLTNMVGQISPGVYGYLATNGQFSAFKIYGDGESGLLVNFDAANLDGSAGLEISGGKVTVGKSGDEYEFSFELQTKVNTIITGYYKGKPIIYSDGKKKLSASGNDFFHHIRLK